jgi:hypothetical protein
MLENATLQQNLLNQFQQLAWLQQQELLHFAEFLVQKQQQSKSTDCHHSDENAVLTQPVTLGTPKYSHLDNVAEIIAATEGEMYK